MPIFSLICIYSYPYLPLPLVILMVSYFALIALILPYTCMPNSPNIMFLYRDYTSCAKSDTENVITNAVWVLI